MTPQVFDDDREIASVWSENKEVGASVGFQGVTKIEVYRELGVGSYVAWFQVWKGDFMAARLNGLRMAEVRYKDIAALESKGTKE